MKNNCFVSLVCLIFSALYYGCVISDDSSFSDVSEPLSEKDQFMYPKDIMFFSQDFHLAFRYKDPVGPYLDTLSNLSLNRLSDDLNTQDDKLAFWINIYNSLVQSKIILDQKSFENKDVFFKSKDLKFGGTNISLDDIEHGILRGKVFGNDFVDTFKLDSLDNRIHFTMNCGAHSCPAIAYYKPSEINEQLLLAENVFTLANSSYDSVSNVLLTSELFSWFREDFNGENGIINIMKINGVVPEHVYPEIKYEAYNWGLKPMNYK